MRVLGAHSSSPSHTLKRTVRRPAKSPPSLAILSASGTGRCRTPAPPDDVQLLQAFRPCLDRSRLAEVTRLTDSRKARTGLRRAGLFILSWGRRRSRARYGPRCRPVQPHRNSILLAREPVAAVQQPALPQVAPVMFRTDVALAGVEHHTTIGARRTSEPSKAKSAVLVRRLRDPAHRRRHLTFSKE